MPPGGMAGIGASFFGFSATIASLSLAMTAAAASI
jgi:hypothetical protein